MTVTRTGWALWLHGVVPVPDLVRLAVHAEERGAAALLLADEGIDRDIYVTFAAVAAATEHITLVPAITNPHSRHPVATAAALGSLEELAPGRVVAGLGAGGSLVFDPLGLAPARPYTALAETVEVVDDLLAGRTVDHHGEFDAVGARLEWAPGRIPIAIAGRGPRVERLGARRADWVVLAGKAVASLPELTARIRAEGEAVGRQPWVVWNPAAGWTPTAIGHIRPHFTYMTVDLPAHDKEVLGIDDDLVARIRETVHKQGIAGAAPLVPDAVLDRFAVIGDRDDVVERLRATVGAAQPDLVALSGHEYTTAEIDDIAAVATDAGLAAADGIVLEPVAVRR